MAQMSLQILLQPFILRFLYIRTAQFLRHHLQIGHLYLNVVLTFLILRNFMVPPGPTHYALLQLLALQPAQLLSKSWIQFPIYVAVVLPMTVLVLTGDIYQVLKNIKKQVLSLELELMIGVRLHLLLLVCPVLLLQTFSSQFQSFVLQTVRLTTKIILLLLLIISIIIMTPKIITPKIIPIKIIMPMLLRSESGPANVLSRLLPFFHLHRQLSRQLILQDSFHIHLVILSYPNRSACHPQTQLQIPASLVWTTTLLAVLLSPASWALIWLLPCLQTS